MTVKHEIALAKPMMSAELTPDGKCILMSGFPGVFTIDAKTGAELTRYREHVGNVVWDARMTRDGKRVVAGNGGQKLEIWDARSAKCLFNVPTEGIVTRLSLSNDGKRAVTSSRNDRLGVWDVARGKSIAALATKKSFVIAAAISPDGKTAMYGGTDGIVRRFDCDKNEDIGSAVGKGWIEVVERSDDGRFWITAGRDKTVMVWDANGAAVRTLRGFSRTITSASISPDGTRVVATGNGKPMVWDTETGKTLASLDDEKVSHVRFSSDGATIVALSMKLVRLHDTP